MSRPSLLHSLTTDLTTLGGNRIGLGRLIGIYGCATFYGCAFATSLTIVPTMFDRDAAMDPGSRLRYWCRQFDISATRWTPFAFASAVALLYTGLKERDPVDLLASGMIWSIFPYTFLFIFPTVKGLKAQAKLGNNFDDNKVQELIKFWTKQHALRVVLTGGALVLASAHVISKAIRGSL